MKRLSKIFVSLLTIFLMVGCANRSVHMDIQNNGKITLSAIIAYAESASSYGMAVTEEEKEEYVKLGYKVEDYKEDDMAGVKISKTYNIKDVSSKDSITVHLESVGSSSFKDEVLFQSVGKNTYKANFVIDTKTGYDSSLASFSSQFDISYSVTLPNAPKSHNADSVDGNTLTWKVNYGEMKDIQYEFSLNGSTLVYTIIGTVVIIAVVVAIIMLVKKNRNKSNPNGMMDSMVQSNGGMMSANDSKVSFENPVPVSGNEQVSNQQPTVSNETSVVPDGNNSQGQS